MKPTKELQELFNGTDHVQYFGGEAVDMALCILSRTNAKYYLHTEEAKPSG